MSSSSSSLPFCMGYLIIMILLMGQVTRSDITQDRNECADQLLGLATCIEYVGGKAKAPTPDCCTGMKQVVEKSKKCLCILVKDKDDPSLGLHINATLALGLPSVCHAPTDIYQCIALLNLAPGSPEAKVFEDFVHSSNGTASASPIGGKVNTTSSSNTTSTPSTKSPNSGGERRKRWLAADVAIITIICILPISL
ncbi:non-specific lipid transfer protein GPI-anchored 14-like [Impatiens glandulifera]|uniref:non-specific lipid transfer protein GPI-anchored 14-like n=1 Tax=Impatiens glandulifera TaxID=253017 RepID=UPI001FB075A3|nr:non-specific lipid transfer protein GPI-anchored 14-like [Impatiens glandulifera]